MTTGRGALVGSLVAWKLAIPIAVPATVPPTIPQSGSVVQPGIGTQVDEYLTRLQALGFAGSVLVARGADIQLRKGYGLAERETNRRITPDTVFTIGSLTKQFTAAAILDLEARGLLDVEDPLTQFFDDVPRDKRAITVHQLLTHTAGLPDTLGDDFDLRATRDWIVDRALRASLVEEPGATHRYSNVGYSLLGAIVEEVSGMGYEVYLRERLLRPAGLDRTGYLLPEFTDEELAIGYRDGVRWGTVIRHPMLADGPGWNLRANGGIHSTPTDMFLWHRALQQGTVLSAAIIERMQTGYVDEGSGDSSYGYGWATSTTQRGTALVWHDGGNGIFSAEMRRYIGEDVFLFVAASNPQYEAPLIGDVLDAVIFGHPYSAPPVALDADPQELSEYPGTYELTPGNTLAVQRRFERLELVADGCWAQYVVSGGETALDPDVDLLTLTARILRANAGGDFAEFTERLPADRSDNAAQLGVAAQNRYQALAVELRGPFREVAPFRCLRNDGGRGTVKVVARMIHAGGPMFRSLRWEAGSIVGWGIHGDPPGGPVELPLARVAPSMYRSFVIDFPTGVTIAFERDPTDPSAPPRLRLQTAAGSFTARRVR